MSSQNDFCRLIIEMSDRNLTCCCLFYNTCIGRMRINCAYKLSDRIFGVCVVTKGHYRGGF